MTDQQKVHVIRLNGRWSIRVFSCAHRNEVVYSGITDLPFSSAELQSSNGDWALLETTAEPCIQLVRTFSTPTGLEENQKIRLRIDMDRKRKQPPSTPSACGVRLNNQLLAINSLEDDITPWLNPPLSKNKLVFDDSKNGFDLYSVCLEIHS